jgi:hypothetical protein
MDNVLYKIIITLKDKYFTVVTLENILVEGNFIAGAK